MLCFGAFAELTDPTFYSYHVNAGWVFFKQTTLIQRSGTNLYVQVHVHVFICECVCFMFQIFITKKTYSTSQINLNRGGVSGDKQ